VRSLLAIVFLGACAGPPAPVHTTNITVPTHREPQRGIGATQCDESFASACGATAQECRAAIDTIAVACAPRAQDLLPPNYSPRELMEVGELMARCTLVAYVVGRQAEGYSCGVPAPDDDTLALCAICADGPTQIMKR
jgi:hypothetical protein